jgi:hypothetical protein
MWLDRRNVPEEVNPRISTSPSPAGIIELNEGRHDLLTVFGIWIHVLSGLEQREVFGAKFFLQFIYLLGQLLSFLAVFLLVGLVELITEIEDLAIGLDFNLIATDDADDLLCQFGSIGLLSLSKQRRRRNNQNPQDQQPVHKFPRDPQVTIPQKTEESSKCHGKQVFELMAAGHFFFCLVMLGPRSSIEPPAGASLYDGTPLPAALVRRGTSRLLLSFCSKQAKTAGPMSDAKSELQLIGTRREEPSGLFRLSYGTEPNDPMPFILTLTPHYVAR